MKKTYSDAEILAAIRAGGKAMEGAMRHIYGQAEVREKILRFIQSKNGSREDAEDVFQDGISHLVMNIRKNSFRGESSLNTYLMVICKKIWFHKFNRQTKLNDIKKEMGTAPEADESSPEKILIYKEKAGLANELLNKIGSPCREILSMWGLSYSMKEIAEKSGYKNEGSMRKKKHQCMKKIMLLIKGQPRLTQLVKETR